MGKGMRILLPALVILLLSAWLAFRMMRPPETVPYFGAHLEGFPIDSARLQNEFSGWAKKPDFIGFFQQWPAMPDLFDAGATLASLESIGAYGAVPVVTLEPMIIDGDREVVIPAQEIIEGRWDQYLTAYATVLRQFGKPLILRFAHEMNIIRYHWGSTAEDYGQSPELYRQMFRHVRQKIHAIAGENIAWMFCPNHQPLTSLNPPQQAEWNSMRVWFPGREYVDLLGIDGYNWGETQSDGNNTVNSDWQTPWDIFASSLEELRALATDAPLLVAETAAIQSGDKRTEWIEQLLQMAYSRHISGLLWFQVNKERDWRIRPEEADKFYKIREKANLVEASTWLQEIIARRKTQLSDSSRDIE
ncbi:MAG: endoglucanase [Candidatus Riflebacteria bacterium HGW-Riflebacteria-2]|jgi:hypothetical protein|nr:MAG: endoglucanase [Candidatus Riflebacteria bacterium HGW-Riflebacteria-2]